MARSYNAGEGRSATSTSYKSFVDSVFKDRLSSTGPLAPKGQADRSFQQKRYEQASDWAKAMDRFPSIRPSSNYFPDYGAFDGKYFEGRNSWESWKNPDGGNTEYNSGEKDYADKIALAKQYESPFASKLEESTEKMTYLWEQANDLNIQIKVDMERVAKNFDKDKSMNELIKIDRLVREFNSVSNAYLDEVGLADSLSRGVDDWVKQVDEYERNRKAEDDNL